MEVRIEYMIGKCSEFMKKEGVKSEVSIIIRPLHIVKEPGINPDGDRLTIISGCNHWRPCENLDCDFSAASRAKRRIEKEEKGFFSKLLRRG